MENEGDDNTDCNWCTWNDPQMLGKRTRSVGNRRKNRDHPSYRMVVIGQNTEKTPGDLRRLAITQTPVKDHQLTLVCKTH